MQLLQLGQEAYVLKPSVIHARTPRVEALKLDKSPHGGPVSYGIGVPQAKLREEGEERADHPQALDVDSRASREGDHEFPQPLKKIATL